MVVTDRLIKKYMGILNNMFKKKIQTNSSCLFTDEKNKANCLYESGLFEECISLCKTVIDEMNELVYSTQEGYLIIEMLIKSNYRINKKDEAYRYIAMLALSKYSINHMEEYLFKIASISFEAGDNDLAKGYIRALYYFSDGAYFCYPTRKKYLDFVGIVDDRTFEDYCQDY